MRAKDRLTWSCERSHTVDSQLESFKQGFQRHNRFGKGSQVETKQ